MRGFSCALKFSHVMLIVVPLTVSKEINVYIRKFQYGDAVRID